MSAAAQEGRFLQQVIQEFDQKEPTVILYCDSTSAVSFAKRQGVGRMRHLDTRELWIQQQVKERKLRIIHIPGDSNPSDIFTKEFAESWKFAQLCEQIGVGRNSDDYAEENLVDLCSELQEWCRESAEPCLLGMMDDGEQRPTARPRSRTPSVKGKGKARAAALRGGIAPATYGTGNVAGDAPMPDAGIAAQIFNESYVIYGDMLVEDGAAAFRSAMGLWHRAPALEQLAGPPPMETGSSSSSTPTTPWQSPPTVRQLDYLMTLLFRRGLLADDARAFVYRYADTKAKASAMINEVKAPSWRPPAL
jgi:hypothetical protein